jgi:hypothetical protein
MINIAFRSCTGKEQDTIGNLKSYEKNGFREGIYAFTQLASLSSLSHRKPLRIQQIHTEDEFCDRHH